MTTNGRQPVVITGFGAVTPLGVGVDTLFRRWLKGDVGIRDHVGHCWDFEPRDHLPSRVVRRTDIYSQLALVAADEAIAHAGWSEGLPVDPTRIACIVGTGFGGTTTFEAQLEKYFSGGPTRVSPLTVPMSMSNAAPGIIALRHGIKGPAHSVSSACATGNDAIAASVRAIRSGEVDAVIAGGADACSSHFGIALSQTMGATSQVGISRPFDARRDGFIMSEGGGILILERGDLAQRRGAKVLGEILGYASTNDAHHLTDPEPEGRGAALAIQRALESANVLPEDLDYVSAHGTSTPANDRAETRAIKAALGEVAMRLPVSSMKSVIGHVMGAAGIVEAIGSVLTLRTNTSPPTVGYEVPEEGLDLNYVPQRPQPLRPRPDAKFGTAISNAFGFGGHNSVVCVRAPRGVDALPV